MLSPLMQRFACSLVALLVLMSCPRVEAQAAPVSAGTPAAGTPETLALTVSGGASLGSYEAGFLYYMIRTMQANPGAFDLRVATGASAGSTNAVLASLASCLPPEDDPFESPFFRVWGRVTFSELFRPEDTEALGALSRAPLIAIADDIGAIWEAGLPSSCDVLLGISVTRVEAYSVNLEDETVHMPRTEEKFALRIRGRGMGRTPDLSNYVDIERGAPTARLPVDGDREGEYEYLRDLVMASSAFPLVFPPQRLRYCVDDPRDADVPPCTPENARDEMFIDGGIFDNQPLNLAAQLSIRGFRESTTPGRGHDLLDVPDVRRRELPTNTFFLFVDPGAPAYPSIAANSEEEEEPAALDFLLEVAGNFVASARAKELRSIIDTHPEIRDRIRLSRSYYPPISSPLGSFFGLFDRQLAAYDFVMGMYDARRLLVEEVIPSFLRRRGLPPEAVRWPEPEAPTGAWQQLSCMRGVFDDDEARLPHCVGLSPRSFLAILQTTLDRLFAHCRAVSANGPIATAHAQCWRAQLGEAPPRVPGMGEDLEGWLPRGDDSDLRYTVRRLAENGFVFRDLGLGPDDGDRAILRIRQELGLLAREFRAAQPRYEELVAAASEYALNELHYVPPRHIVSLDVVPNIELGYSFGEPYGRASWLRFTVALGFSGLMTVLSSSENHFGLHPSLGVEFEPVRMNGSIFRMRFGLRGGYAFNTTDDFGRGVCLPRDQHDLRCSRPFANLNVIFTFVDIVRVVLGVAYAPPFQEQTEGAWVFTPAIGLQWRSSQ